MEVLLAVAQRDMVARTSKRSRRPASTRRVDVEPLAAGRALINLTRNGLATKNVVVVNIGAANTDVGIFKNGILRFPRTLPLAGDNFTRAIADHLGLSMEAAEEEKRENAVIMMDLLSGVGSAGDFAPASETPGPAATGRTPFDFSVDTPAAGRRRTTIRPPRSGGRVRSDR
jgi:type IV pilus assembly protein PilM